MRLLMARRVLRTRPPDSRADAQKYRRTDAQTHRRTDAQTHRRTDAQTHRRTDAQTHRRTDAQTHRRTDAQTHRRTDAQTHRRTDAQTHRRTDAQTQQIKVYCRRRGRRRIHNINPKSQCDRANNVQQPAPVCKTKSQCNNNSCTISMSKKNHSNMNHTGECISISMSESNKQLKNH